jgi:hypothetical protein
MSTEQRIRAVLFYLSVCIFFIGLPLILSFALSYKFNLKTFKFTKTGLIVLRTQPQGASIYFQGKLLNDKTPSTVNELMPGKYAIKLELEKYYSWNGEIDVEAGKVSRLEKIILFPLRPNIKQLNKDKISAFWFDEKKDRVYYVGGDSNSIYESNIEGENFQEIGSLPESIRYPYKWKLSVDKEKLFAFNQHKIAVVTLNRQKELIQLAPPVILDYPDSVINDAFWHSDNYHIILITNKSIEVVEAAVQGAVVNLVNLNKKNIPVFYDDTRDALYFIDSQKAEDGRYYDNAYKLELGVKLFPFKELIGPRQTINDERSQN